MSEVKIDFSNLKKVHFIGVGGISMSALAEATIAKNIKVSGSISGTVCTETSGWRKYDFVLRTAL